MGGGIGRSQIARIAAVADTLSRRWKAAILSMFWCGAGQFSKGEYADLGLGAGGRFPSA